MSIVRYTNKETGVVTLYESTSYYDPVTKQSRPKRKYLGIEDPESGELVPSSGKRGRKKAAEGAASAKKETQEQKLKIRYDKLEKECTEKAERIKQLEHENKRLRFSLKKLSEAVDDVMNSLE